MDALKLLPDLYNHFIILVMIFARISTALITLNIFKRVNITYKVIVALSAILSIYVLLLNPVKQTVNDIYSFYIVLNLVFQVFVGFIGGFIANIVLEVFIAIGQILSTQVGLSIISVLDPGYGMITGLTQFYINTATIIFLFLNGHLFIIKTILLSFDSLPIYHIALQKNMFHEILNYAGIIFSGSILASITVLITCILTNISMAVMSKFAPQFNLFSFGISFLLVIGFFCVYFTFDFFVEDAFRLINHFMDFLTLTFSGFK